MRNALMIRKAVAAGGLALALAGGAAAQAPWPAEFVNPRPLDGDVMVPLPCGAALAFRRVAVPTAPGALEDRRVVVGDTDPETNWVEHVRPDHLAAPFALPDGTRFYLIGKYEVTRDQFAAVMQPACPAPSAAGTLPAAGLTWFDAVGFAERANEWLRANAPGALPRADDAAGFLRLPTEAEWEYAARGGAAVSESEFRGRVFPLNEPLVRAAWFQGPRSAQGEAHPVGRLAPNPLGLFDVLGNVAELVLEPFRVNRGERLQGQAGGAVVRGGDFQTPEARLRASARIELPPFSAETGQPVRLPTVGLRLAVGAVAITSLARAEAMRREWAEAVERGRAAGELNAGRPIDPDQDADALLQALAARTQADDLRRSLARIQQALAEERAARANERMAREAADARSAGAAIDSGAILIRLMRDYDYRARAFRALIAARGNPNRETPDDRRRRAEMEQNAATLDENLHDTVETYLRLVDNTARAFAPALLDGQLALWLREHQGPRFAGLARFARVFVEQTAAQRSHPEAVPRRLIDAILALP